MPANSDYAPVLDLNAARQRFMEKSAADVVALLNAERAAARAARARAAAAAPVNPLFKGAYAFERVENTRLAWYARDFLLRPRPPVPEAVPTQLQKDLELVKLRLIECREPRELDVWLHSALRVAQRAQSLPRARRRWRGVGAHRGKRLLSPSLQEFQRRWIALFQAVGARNAARMAELAGAAARGQQPELGRRCARIPRCSPR